VHGWRARIGLLVPSSNTTAEPEFCRMAPEGVSVHAARMRLTEVTPEALLEMGRRSEEAARELADAEVDVIVYGCTTGSLIGGPDFDLELARRLEAVCRLPVVTAATAVAEALRELGVRNVAVATPYTDDLNLREKVFLEGKGFRVAGMRGLGIVRNAEIGRLHPSVAYELARGAFTPEAEGVFISCTNFRAIEVIDPLEKDLGRPVVTSNQASMWAALRRLRVSERIPGYGKLLREHL